VNGTLAYREKGARSKKDWEPLVCRE